MAKAPDPESVARAERLRKEIEKLTQPDSEQADKPSSDEADKDPAPLSPREFIHKRMRELDKKKDED